MRQVLPLASPWVLVAMAAPTLDEWSSPGWDPVAARAEHREEIEEALDILDDCLAEMHGVASDDEPEVAEPSAKPADSVPETQEEEPAPAGE